MQELIELSIFKIELAGSEWKSVPQGEDLFYVLKHYKNLYGTQIKPFFQLTYKRKFELLKAV